jgi:2-dehydro-3-deoxyphosphooctonate aldolase (KDO 8-P synthase)
MKIIHVANLKLGGAQAPLFIIAGPCILETEAMALRTAETLAGICQRLRLPYIFKASYDKANRTSNHSFRGLGREAGLAILARVKQQVGVPVLTDVHVPGDCSPVAAVADVLQIPAFLCRQTDLVQAAARTGKCVNIKKGQFLAPGDMSNVVAKITAVGGKSLMLTERGASFGYHNLVADLRSLVIMRELGWPVVFDATHSTQMPGAAGTASGGDRRMGPVLARAAVATGHCDGIFIEVHPRPEKALSDAATQLPLRGIGDLLATLRDIHELARQGSG